MDTPEPYRLYQVIDPALDVDVCILDHGGGRLLGHAARRQKTWEVADLAELLIRSSIASGRVS
ncbi:MAG: hypothetical protein J0H15_10800 [Xanthomonadales bacterium]|nr:hypothetical protein [Xanthomonadales bacterium]